MATASASEFEQDPFGDFHLQRLRDRPSLGQCPVIEFEVFSDNELNPLLMREEQPFVSQTTPAKCHASAATAETIRDREVPIQR
jgi:hypothetical protein